MSQLSTHAAASSWTYRTTSLPGSPEVNLQQPYPILEDILKAQPNISKDWSLGRIIQDGDFHVDQAEFHLTSGEDADALREHVIASIVVNKIAPEHADYSSGAGPTSVAQYEHYQSLQNLQRRLKAQHKNMERIKSTIKEENERWEVEATGMGGAIDHKPVEIIPFDDLKDSLTNKTNTELFLPQVEYIEYSPYKNRRGKFFRGGVGRRHPQVSTQQAPDQNHNLQENIPPESEHRHPVDHEFSHTEYSSHKVVPFTSIKQLGQGALGIVDAVRHDGVETDVVLARKVIALRDICRKELLNLIQQEVAVLRELSHPHIVSIVCTYETISVPRQFGILLTPVGDEDLNHYLERVGENEFPEQDIQNLKKWQYCLASAVSYIHSQNVRHKDIKPSNAICKGDQIFLTDFGSAHRFGADLTSSTEGFAANITKMYSAPEVIEQDRRGRPADIYSLGCVFAEMTTVIHARRVEDFHEFRREPNPKEPGGTTRCYYATAHKVLDWFETGCDPVSLQLITSMLKENQKLRPTAEGVIKSLEEYSRYSDCSCRFLANSRSGLGSGMNFAHGLSQLDSMRV